MRVLDDEDLRLALRSAEAALQEDRSGPSGNGGRQWRRSLGPSADGSRATERMDPRRYLAVAMRWWWLLLLVPLLAGAAAYFVTRTVPFTYRATTLLFVNQTANPNAITYNDALLSQQLVKTYSRMVQQPVVLEPVVERLGLPMDAAALGRMVSVQPIRETQLFEIAVEGTSPSMIRDVANAIAAVFVEQQSQQRFANQTSGGLWVAQPALEPIEPIGPKPLLNATLAAVLGLMLVVALVALLEFLDDTVKTPEDLAQAASLTTLGSVTRLGGRNGESVLISPTRRQSTASEAYRLVRTNLEFASVDEPLTTLLVTSSSPGEGKSTTAANLAIVLAQAGKRVILVDADMRRPTLHRLFGVPNHQGLSNLLLCDVERLDNHLKAGGIANLRVMPAGPLPPNPAELLSSSRLPKLLERLKTVADMVVIDSPPVLAVSDAIILAGRVDGTLMVVDSNRTRPHAVRRSAEALANSGTRLLGAVLNKLNKRAGGYAYYYGEYGAASAAPELGAGS